MKKSRIFWNIALAMLFGLNISGCSMAETKNVPTQIIEQTTVVKTSVESPAATAAATLPEPTTVEVPASAPQKAVEPTTVEVPTSAPQNGPEPTIVEEPTSAPQKTTVPSTKDGSSSGSQYYYTRTGTKYHNINPCGNGTYYPCTLEEALRRGLEPCAKCIGG